MQRVSVWFLALTAAVATTGCVNMDRPDGAFAETSQSVDLGGARAVSIEVTMSAGELQMQGGAGRLMDAAFRYRPAEGRPEVKYNVVGGHGRLIVRTPREVSAGRHDSTWNLRLKDDIPLDVAVKMGAGANRLDLGNVDLRKLQVEMGAGELKLDLSGNPRHDMDVRVRGGVGQATVRLPRSAAVEVTARGGIGGINVRGLEKRGDVYVNDVHDTAAVAVRVDVRGGIGGINLICE